MPAKIGWKFLQHQVRMRPQWMIGIAGSSAYKTDAILKYTTVSD